jgi:hypothetical protein
MLVNVIVFVTIAIAGGLGTSWYMIEKGSRLTTRTAGPWVTWVSAGRPQADPYTRAHHIRRGILPVSSALTQTFEAMTDSEGQALYSSCEYLVEGEEPQAFWSLSVFDESGRLISNQAERYSFNSTTLMHGPSPRIQIVVARDARPGNWLPTGGGGRLSLHFQVDEAPSSLPGAEPSPPPLPVIRRIACR